MTIHEFTEKMNHHSMNHEKGGRYEQHYLKGTSYRCRQHKD